jgi:hypothetical protein
VWESIEVWCVGGAAGWFGLSFGFSRSFGQSVDDVCRRFRWIWCENVSKILNLMLLEADCSQDLKSIGD